MGHEQKPKGIRSLGMVKGGLIVAAILCVGLAAISGPALAGKGGTHGSNQTGNGHGRGHATPVPTGTCSVTPNPAGLGSVIVISGSGFPAYSGIGITVRGPNGEGPQVGFATADAAGNFSTEWSSTWAGTNTVTASGGGAAATCTFEAV